MSEQMRKEFEDWYKDNINKDGPFMACGKMMRSEHAMFGLMCWQASRQSLVVKLPVLTVYGVDADDYYKSVLVALDDAGVKYE